MLEIEDGEGTPAPPTRSWNYRVIEFHSDDETGWRAIHEVYYVDGVPKSYSEHPASVVWDIGERNASALSTLERMREADYVRNCSGWDGD